MSNLRQKTEEDKNYFKYELVDMKLFNSLETIGATCYAEKCNNRVEIIIQHHDDRTNIVETRLCKEHLKKYVDEMNENYKKLLPIIEQSETAFKEIEEIRKKYY